MVQSGRTFDQFKSPDVRLNIFFWVEGRVIFRRLLSGRVPKLIKIIPKTWSGKRIWYYWRNVYGRRSESTGFNLVSFYLMMLHVMCGLSTKRRRAWLFYAPINSLWGIASEIAVFYLFIYIYIFFTLNRKKDNKMSPFIFR